MIFNSQLNWSEILKVILIERTCEKLYLQATVMEGDLNAASTDNVIPADGSRLPSFKGPRDLTLSKNGRSRRHYVPNIPPKRERSETNHVPVSSLEPKTREHSQTQLLKHSLPGKSQFRPRPPGHGGLGIHTQRGGTRARPPRPELVQSPSIFAEGVGSSKFLGSRSTAGVKGTGSKGSNHEGKKPSSSVSEIERAIRREQRTEEDISVEVDDDEPIGGLGTFVANLHQGPIPQVLRPVALPLSKYLTRDPTLALSKLRPGDPMVNLIRSRSKSCLVCLQLPDVLPFRKELTITNENVSEDEDPQLLRELQSVKRGEVGKLLIFASGRACLLLGRDASTRSKFELQPSRAIAFRQELVAVDETSKKVYQLGKVQHKYMCIPELEALFQKVL